MFIITGPDLTVDSDTYLNPLSWSKNNKLYAPSLHISKVVHKTRKPVFCWSCKLLRILGGTRPGTVEN